MKQSRKLTQEPWIQVEIKMGQQGTDPTSVQVTPARALLQGLLSESRLALLATQ